MDYYNNEEVRTEEGVYVKHHNGFFTFRFSFDEIVVFEEVNTAVLEKFDLRSDEYIGAVFEVTYKEIFDDLDEDDFLIFRIMKLRLL